MAVNGLTRRSGNTVIFANGCRGIALARIMITIAIIAIVGTVAVPISRDHLESTHISQAIADIGAIEIAISRYQAQYHGQLPIRLADLGVKEWQDPWGHAYRYRNLEIKTGRDQARESYDLSRVNRDYDLYSMGKDGRSALSFKSPVAKDDIVRGLSGSYYGTVLDYPRASSER